MKLYELKIEDNEDEVFAISLVESPAIESDFIFFDKEEVMFAATDKEQQMLIGPILLADKKILRVDGEGQPYHVYFTKETVKKIAQNYLMKKYTDKATLEHDMSIKGVHLVESWIKEGKLDKSNNYGLSVPEGTWMGMFKITDPMIWKDYVKTGKVKGFSIEGLFTHNLIHASKEDILSKDINDFTEVEAEMFLSTLKAIIKKDKRYGKGERIEMEAYSDYPQSVRDAARIAREQNEKVGNKCMTNIGRRRSADLEAGRPLSRETIARMVSYLSRAKDVYEQNKSDRTSCAYIAYKGWGGETALTWAENKLKQIDMSAVELKEGVPHYTADGKLWEGPTHKDASGRLMTGAEHNETSRFLYHEEQFAEVGPRGGIKESPKAPKSGTPNPEPKGEGSAKGDASGKRGAKVTAEQEKTLEEKVKDFNERESNTKNGNATLGALKSVFQRGLGAYNTSHSPNVQSAEQWAYARVNAFLYLLKNGRPENPKYTTDYDLLPKGHPKASEKMEVQPSITSSYPGEVASGSIAPALK